MKNRNTRNNKEYRTWRAKVIRRDKRCIICNSIKRRSAHHLNSYKYFEDERYDIKNGITLCSKCHIKYHTAYKKSFREKNTKENFENFIQLLNYLKDIKINKDVKERYIKI